MRGTFTMSLVEMATLVREAQNMRDGGLSWAEVNKRLGRLTPEDPRGPSDQVRRIWNSKIGRQIRSEMAKSE